MKHAEKKGIKYKREVRNICDTRGWSKICINQNPKVKETDSGAKVKNSSKLKNSSKSSKSYKKTFFPTGSGKTPMNPKRTEHTDITVELWKRQEKSHHQPVREGAGLSSQEQ